LLWHALTDLEPLNRWPWATAVLKREADLRRGQAQLLLPHAARLAITPLTDAGLQPLVLKGPSIALRYPALDTRPMDDLDLLLPRRSIAPATRALTHAGWRAVDRSGDHYDAVFMHAAVPHFPLELHHGLTSWQDRSTRLDPDKLWRARTPFDCLGTLAYRLPPEEELIALVAHAAKPFHQFERLIWSVDLAVLLADCADHLDWSRVADLAARAGASTMLAIGLRHAVRLGAAAPSPTMVLPPGALRGRALSALLTDTWPLDALSEAQKHQLRYALPDQYRTRAMLAVGEVYRDGPTHTPQHAAALAARLTKRLWDWRATAPGVRRSRGRTLIAARGKISESD
jgi:hypothetical protein